MTNIISIIRLGLATLFVTLFVTAAAATDINIQYSRDFVFIAGTPIVEETSTCGKVSCRTLQANVSSKEGFFEHGGPTPQQFVFFDPDDMSNTACVEFGDRVRIVGNGEAGIVRAIVAGENGQKLDFEDVINPNDGIIAIFYVFPVAGSFPQTGCIVNRHPIVLTLTPDSGDTDNCGWNGCRVLQMGELTDMGQQAILDHGGDKPKAVFVAKTGVINAPGDLLTVD